MSGVGKCIKVVNNKHTKWKHIPVAVGGSAPKRNDLIEFEELEFYDMVSPQTKRLISSEKKNKIASTASSKQNNISTKKKRLNKREKLKQLILNKNDSAHPASPAVVDTSDTCKTVPRKLSAKRKGTTVTTGSKKLKQSSETDKSEINDSEKSQELEMEIAESDLKLSMSEWSNFYVPMVVLKALNELGFYSPMPIQSKVLHAAIIEKRDIVGAAETGSGKTLAFGIPLLHHLLEDKTRQISGEFESNSSKTDDYSDAHLHAVMEQRNEKFLPALVLTPTRELALQVMKHLKNVAKYTGIWISAVVGGMSLQKQIRLLSKGPDIVVATPGRLWEIINEDNSYLSRLHCLNYLVIDEADRMLEQGHFEDLTKILEHINTAEGSSKKRQTYIFSATLTVTHVAPHRVKQPSSYQPQTKEIKLAKLMKKIGIRNKPHVVDLTTKKMVAAALSEGKIICHYSDKDLYLYYFLKSFPGRTLVFANSIDCIFRLSALFNLLGCQPLHIHAKMQQRQRLKHLDRFQDQPNAVMFASDVAARGLDIPNVRHVIHYQTPRTMETYIHRSGRCARSGKEGYSLMLISPQELQLYKKLCRNLDKEEGIADFVVDDIYMSAIRKRVNMAREIDALAHQQKKVDLTNSWFSKAAKETGIALDRDLIVGNRDADLKKLALTQQKKRLQMLIATPVFPAGFSGTFLTKQGSLTLPGLEENPQRYTNKKKNRRRNK